VKKSKTILMAASLGLMLCSATLAAVGEDATQVLNGIVGAELDPHPGAYEVKKFQAPVALRLHPGWPLRLTVANKHHAADLSHLRLEWEIIENGRSIESGTAALPHVVAGAEGDFALDATAPSGDPAGRGFFLNVRCVLNRDLPWAPAGHLVAWDQFPLPCGAPARIKPLPTPTGKAAMERTGGLIRVSASSGSWKWEESTGLLPIMVGGFARTARAAGRRNVAPRSDGQRLHALEEGALFEGLGSRRAHPATTTSRRHFHGSLRRWLGGCHRREHFGK
jgi:beta-galactosidase/beta-glucuronidase